ncbi:MAG: HEAT repeat domain-containing protein [Candidatus Riflebacteria bacterium]|nr:HEAT repeat domain-containing protein [Candidatus Riflebacteria bacterium]
MPPVKKHELIIQNLNSIFSAVRKQSLTQLFTLPSNLVSQEKKIELAKKALEDSEPDVRDLAFALLKQIGIPTAEISISKIPQQFSKAPVPPVEKAVSKPVEKTPTQGIAIPEKIENTEKIQKTGNIQIPVKPDKPEKAVAAEVPTKATFIIEAPFLDDPLDSSLPDPATLKSIPSKLEYLSRLGHERPSGALYHLLIFAQDIHEEVALTALQTILNLRDPRAASQVLPFLVMSGFSSQRRFLILKIVMESRSALDVESLEQVLRQEKDVIVKSGLVKVFARHCGDSGVETLKWCLKDADSRVRANTIEVLEEIKIDSCVEEVAELLNDSENRVKVNAAKFLVRFSHPEAFPTLKKMLGSSELWLRDSVIYALGEIGDTPSLTLLKAALKDPNQGIRLSVLKALAKINTEIARQGIQQTTQDNDQVVAQVARGLWEKIKNTQVAQPKQAVQAPVLPAAVNVKAPDIICSKPEPEPEPELESESEPEPEPEPEQQPEPEDSKPVSLPNLRKMPATVSGSIDISRNRLPDRLSKTEESENTDVPEASLPIEIPDMPDTAKLRTVPSKENKIPDNSEKHEIDPFRRGLDDLHIKPASSVSNVPVPPAAKVTIPSGGVPTAKLNLLSRTGTGGPAFQKPRSAEVYTGLSSADSRERQKAANDMTFIMGDDQSILVAFAAESSDNYVRLAAAKILSRKRGPGVLELLKKLSTDNNELVRSMAQKALTMAK